MPTRRSRSRGDHAYVLRPELWQRRACSTSMATDGMVAFAGTPGQYERTEDGDWEPHRPLWMFCGLHSSPGSGRTGLWWLASMWPTDSRPNHRLVDPSHPSPIGSVIIEASSLGQQPQRAARWPRGAMATARLATLLERRWTPTRFGLVELVETTLVDPAKYPAGELFELYHDSYA